MGRLAPFLLVLPLVSCFGPGLLTDGSSVSYGSAADGALRRGSVLADVGEGYQVAPSWRPRHAGFGTDELVDALVRIGRRLARDFPGTSLVLGDISYRGGRESPRHRSHQNGRDVDVFFFAVDDRGRALGPYDAMVPFAEDGRSLSWRQNGELRHAWGRRFDDARNWGTVRAFLSEPAIEVQWMFVHQGLSRRMLTFAAEHHEDPELIARASLVMQQPSRSLPHDDHLHVRIYCDPGDRAYGCVDRGPVRWLKKHRKYLGSRAVAGVAADGQSSGLSRLAALLPSSMRVLAQRPLLWRR